MRRISLIALLTVTLAVPMGRGPAVAATRLDIVRITGGLNDPSGFTIAPSGHIWYLERGTGRVMVLDPRTDRVRRFFRIRGVDGSGERGALGIALHPGWPTPRTLFVYVTRSSGGGPRNQLVRIRRGGSGVRLRVLWSTPSNSNHNGGRILFGAGGKLYVVTGDGGNPANSQDLTRNKRGKILRVDLDGSPASGNPSGHIWAFGIRNSFGLAIDPRTGRLWDLQNGPTCNDEINRIVRGGNYAWGPRQACGTPPRPRDTNHDGPSPRRLPEHTFADALGITGGAFCHRCNLRDRDEGKLFFGTVVDGRIRIARLDARRLHIVGIRTVLSSPNGAVHSMEVARGGRIYFSDHEAIYRIVAR